MVRADQCNARSRRGAFMANTGGFGKRQEKGGVGRHSLAYRENRGLVQAHPLDRLLKLDYSATRGVPEVLKRVSLERQR